MTSILHPQSPPASSKITIPTWKLTALMIQNQWGPYMLYFLFSLLIFAEQLAPGLIVKAIFDRLSGQEAQSNVTFLWGMIALYLAIEVARLLVAIGYEDMGEVTDFPTWIPDQVGKWVAAAIAVVIMARINLTITLVIFIPLFGTILLSRLAWGRLLGTYRQGRLALDAATGFLGEVFGSVQAVKVAGAEEGVVDHLAALNSARARVEVRQVFYRGLLSALNNSVVNIYRR